MHIEQLFQAMDICAQMTKFSFFLHKYYEDHKFRNSVITRSYFKVKTSDTKTFDGEKFKKKNPKRKREW